MTKLRVAPPAAAVPPGPGHNSGAQPSIGPATDRLRSIIERWERLDEEIKALRGDQKDIFAEAKSAGYDLKALRLLLKRRKMEPAEYEEQQSLLDTYAHALGMI